MIKNAGLFDDLMEFNSFFRPRSAELVFLRSAKSLQVTKYPYLNMRNSMTPDPEKYSCNLNAKERIEFICYQRFHTRSYLTQYSIKQWSPDHSAKLWSLFDESDVSLFIINLNWATWFGRQTFNEINFMPLHRTLPKQGLIDII